MPILSARVARPIRPQAFHIVAAVAAVALFAACTATPGATVAPTVAPIGQPPTAEPTPTIVPTPTFGEGQIEHPTGATDVVLRMEVGGGFMPIEFYATQSPTFTLYGDGTVIFRPSDSFAEWGEPQPPFVTGNMNEEAVQALLQYALGTGKLATAREQYDNPMVADAPTTVFNINAGGVEKVVSIYGLGLAIPGEPDASERAGFVQLSELLSNFENEVEAGTVTEAAPYDAEMYRVTMFPDMGGVPTQEPIDWPWADLTLDDFPKGDEPGAIRMMSRDEVAQLTNVPNGGQLGIWVTAPDDSLVQFAVRPLLPDEQATVEAL